MWQYMETVQRWATPWNQEKHIWFRVFKYLIMISLSTFMEIRKLDVVVEVKVLLFCHKPSDSGSNVRVGADLLSNLQPVLLPSETSWMKNKYMHVIRNSQSKHKCPDLHLLATLVKYRPPRVGEAAQSGLYFTMYLCRRQFKQTWLIKAE